MSSYKIYLTKSSEAARAISRGYSCGSKDKANSVKRIQYGSADGENIIPAIFQGQGYFHCAIEYHEADNSKAPGYELIIC